MQICPNCGEENPDRFRICGICGTSLAPEAPPQEVRKTVSIVFCDLKGSTDLGEKLDTEALREVLAAYFSAMKNVLERHGGTVEKFIGDAVMAVFGLPTLHEDDALRAVRAAYDMKQALGELNDTLEARWGVRLENRTGVNTGEVVAGDVTTGQRLVTGDAVNTAARLEQAAPSLEILIGEPTYRLVRDAVEAEPIESLALKGKAETVAAYRLVSVKEGEGVARRLDAPMVGRADQLQLLLRALDQAIEQRRPQLVTVLGPAGVGKSRLLGEFIDRAATRATSVRGRCLSYGQGITFFPLGEMVREAADIQNDDSLEVAKGKLAALLGSQNADVAERVAATIGLSASTFPQEETFWSARRYLEILATQTPLIALVDDIHWAEHTFLDLIQYVVDSARDAPIVIVCSSRAELREEHPEWLTEKDNASSITLEPLTAEESSMVMNNLLGTTTFNESARTRIIETAEGNPLFVEQMLSMLVDDGILQQDPNDQWILVSDLGALVLPPTINALLTARLDRLSPSERAVIERGAVIGQVFFRGAVEDLAPHQIRDRVGQSLTTLVRKEFIRPHEAEFAGQESYAFLHGLIKDAAYHGLLKRTRAELHEKFVSWAERVAPERVLEYEEILGYHLEQAFLILAQLGPIDDHGREVGIQGARHLSSAGRRARARGDMPAAANLLQRAASLLPEMDPGRPRLLVMAGEAFLEQGEFEMADAVLTSAKEGAALLEDRGLQTTARLVQLQLHFLIEGEGSEEELIEEVKQAVPVLQELGYHEDLARAWRLAFLVYGTALRWSAAEQAAQRMIEHARQAGDDLMETRLLTDLAMCALYGPMPVPEAIERCRALLERASRDRKAEAITLAVLAELEAMRRNFEEARELYRRSRAGLEELGWKFHAALTSIHSAPVELLAGDPIGAESELRRDYDALEAMRERNYISTTAGFLAEALYQQDRFEEAESFVQISKGIAAPDDLSSQLLWRGVLGKILARTGMLEDADRLVREAVQLMQGSEEPVSQGYALMDLAEVLRLAGREDDAAVAIKEAIGLFDEKGNLVAAERARELLVHSQTPSLEQPPG